MFCLSAGLYNRICLDLSAKNIDTTLSQKRHLQQFLRCFDFELDRSGSFANVLFTMAAKPRSPAEAAYLASKTAQDGASPTIQADPPVLSGTSQADPALPDPGTKPKKKCNIPPEKRWRGGRPKGYKNKKIPARRAYRSKGQDLRETSLQANREALASIRDIAPLPNNVDWARRLACKRDLGLFCKTYLPRTFELSWSKNHLACIEKIEIVFLQGGKFALAMPRGEGKTALCRAAMIWGTAYGHRLFPFMIGSAQPKAVATLEYIKAAWYGSVELRQDFPEIAHPVFKLENRWHLARGQIFHGQSTYIEWGTDSVRYPILLLSREEAQTYLDHDSDFLIHLPEIPQNPDGTGGRPELWMPKTAGLTINTSGVDGSIRGEAGVHPIILTQPRPDVVLIDDVQKDNKVDSSLSCDKLKLLIDGAIGLLSGPTESIAAIMPCTVMREGDVADTFVDPEKRPEWRGERHARVISWPAGITDEKITLDSSAGRCWTEYDRLRRVSLKQFKDIRLATAYYIENREVMDAGFVCSWPERFDKTKCDRPWGTVEISAQQSCMNLRLEIGSVVFMAECQNKGRKPLGEGVVLVKKEQLAEKTTSLQRRVCPIDTKSLVVHIDVQNEILYWAAFACAPDFTGSFVDYGTFPKPYLPYFRKEKTEEWSLLSGLFFEAYPAEKQKAIQERNASKYGYRAPLEAKIYHALSVAVREILRIPFIRDDPFSTPIHINKIGIDTRWGQVSETIKRFIRDWSKSPESTEAASNINRSGWVSRDILVPYFGKGITAEQRQMEEYDRARGWLFEDQVNPLVREVKWVWKPDQQGLYCLHADVNRLKTFLFQRLASPLGSSGSVSLFSSPAEVHELFAEHICESEYPEILGSFTRSLKKEMWKEREGVRFDNDYLDVAAACMALASFSGTHLQHLDEPQASTPQKKRLSDQWKQKRQIRDR